MKPLTLDGVQEAVPGLDELRPILDHLIEQSRPNPDRAWSGSGELDTVGARLVPHESLGAEVEALAATEAERLGAIYACMARALDALSQNDRMATSRALLDASAMEESRDRPDRAGAYAETAYRVVRDERDQRQAALALRRWARASRTQGHLVEALDRYSRAHGLASAMSDARGAAEAAVGAGNVLEEQGRWPEAAEWYRAALAAVDGQGPVPEQWHAFLNLHIVTRSRGAVDESVPWLERAEAVAARLDAEGAAPLLENARGQLAMARGAFGDAERHLKLALSAATSTRQRVILRLNLAETLLAQERVLDAAEQARQAERDAIRGGLVTKLPEVYRLLGRISSADGNADAFVFFERALDIIRERALPVLEEALTLQAYAECEAGRGETDAARQLHDRAVERFRSLEIAHVRRRWADVYAPTSQTKTQDG